ncbi:hypothetical protein JCM3774_001791 [Rhodotorula dairenensis]
MLNWSSHIGNKLFGPDPKLEFTRPGQGLDLLARNALIPDDSPYWRQYLTLFDSPTDLVLLLPASHLAHALRTNPTNLVSLIRFSTRTLVRHASPSARSAPQSRSSGWDDLPRHVLNAVRVLARVLPVVLAPRDSATPEGDDFETAVFWSIESTVDLSGDQGHIPTLQGTTGDSGAEGQFVLASDDDDEDDDRAERSPQAGDSASRPLAEQLLSALVDLLFVPGLSLPRSAAVNAAPVVYTIWEPGIACAPSSDSASSSPASTELPILLARLEILRLLTLLISLPSLLTAPGLFTTTRNRWRDALVSGRVVGAGDKKVVLCLLCSVLNTALAEGIRVGHAAAPSTTATAGGLEGLKERAARLAAETARRTTDAATGRGTTTAAYSGTAGHDATIVTPGGARLALVEACWQFLDVVLIEHPADDVAAAAAENQFAYYVARLHRPADFDRLADGSVGFLVAALMTDSAAHTSPSLLGSLAGAFSSSSSSTTSSPTPSSAAPARCATEALVVLSRLVETNRKLVPHLAAHDPAALVRVLVAVVACLVDWSSQGDSGLLGQVRLASIVLQTLTARVASSRSAGPDGAHDGLVRALNAPLEPRVIGPALAAIVRRQMAAQGVAGSLDAAAGSAGAGDSKAETPKAVTFSEYLVISLHALVLPPMERHSPAASASYRAALSTLYPSLILAVTNLSPLVRELESDAATRLARVWLAFSAPSWILMEEGNPRLVFYLLEAFNNIAQYNLDRNPHLFYALAVALPRFDLLANFTLALGIAEARRLRAARRERLRPIREGPEEERSASVASRRSSHDDGPSEKALGKRRASSVSLGGLSLTDDRDRDRDRDRDHENESAGPSLGRSESSASLGGASMLSADQHDSTNGGEGRPFVGRNGFTPTEGWVASWREGLPLDTVLVLLSEVRHRLVELDASFPAPRPSADVISSLRKVLASPEVQSILPPKPDVPTRTRKFVASPSAISWLASVIYGRLYLSQIDYLRDSLPVQLFAVAHAPKHAPRLGQLGAEMERVSRSATQVGGRVGGVLSGVLGRFA